MAVLHLSLVVVPCLVRWVTLWSTLLCLLVVVWVSVSVLALVPRWARCLLAVWWTLVLPVVTRLVSLSPVPWTVLTLVW